MLNIRFNKDTQDMQDKNQNNKNQRKDLMFSGR